MAYLDKTIKSLQYHLEAEECCSCVGDAVELLKEYKHALALLKEQDKTGHWIYKKYDDMFMCSCCEKYSIRNDYPYCHWCGAKMKGR